jgi:hypothetical protein
MTDDDDLRRFHLTKDKERDDWKLTEEGNDRARARFETKEAATKGGVLKEELGQKGGSVRIHKVKGRIQEERTYPRSKDPRGSKG